MARAGERVAIVACAGDDPRSTATALELTRHLAPSASVQLVKDLCIGSRALSSALREHTGDFIVLLPCSAHRGHPRAVQLRQRAKESVTRSTRLVVINPTDLLSDDAGQWATLACVAASSAALVGPRVAAIFDVAAPAVGGVSRRAVLTGRLRERREPPTAPRQTWEAFVWHVLVGAREVGLPIGLWWTCVDADDPPSPHPDTAWLRLRVPCVRALTPAWVLQPLSRGATQVTVTSCDSASSMWAAVASMPRLLAELAVGLPASFASSALNFQEPVGTVAALGDFPLSAPSFIASEHSPLGVVTCAERSCTACGLCVERCPTGALRADERPSSWALSFTHASCVACAACVTNCPEHALTLHRGVQPADLRVARELSSTNLRHCVVCGAKLAAPALMRRLAEVGVRWPDDGRCGDCRTAGRTADRSA